MPCTCARCCPTCKLRTPPARPSTPLHPARTAPRSPRADVPVDAATQAPGPGLSPRAALPATRRSHGPQLAPGTPSDPTVWGSWGLCRPPAGPPAPPSDRHGPRTRTAPPPPRPPAATHAPGPGLSPQATQPAHRRSLGPQRCPHGARRRPCARAPRSLACRTRPPPARPPTPPCGALRATADRRLDRPHPPRPPRAPHPHGAASASAARRYPCARPRPQPPAGCAARPPVSRTQGQALGDST